MKAPAYLILTTTLPFAALSIYAQDVTIGDITFTSTSADPDATWYDPMVQEGAIVLDGFGALNGKTRTITYSAGEAISGVKTIKRKCVETAVGESTEEIWIAFDSNDDARVLKIVRSGNLVFQANATATPPLYMPSLPKDGQSWDLSGTTVTVDSVIASNSGTCLKVTYKTGEQAESRFLRVGDGIIYIEAGSDSGWRPRAKLPTP
jgi:hypothetical protein